LNITITITLIHLIGGNTGTGNIHIGGIMTIVIPAGRGSIIL
jgi:hypothetical protein